MMAASEIFSLEMSKTEALTQVRTRAFFVGSRAKWEPNGSQIDLLVWLWGVCALEPNGGA
jgi:hypothetical protein